MDQKPRGFDEYCCRIRSGKEIREVVVADLLQSHTKDEAAALIHALLQEADICDDLEGSVIKFYYDDLLNELSHFYRSCELDSNAPDFSAEEILNREVNEMIE